MASLTVNLAPTIPSGTATVYPRSNWPTTVDPSGTPVGSSTTSAAVGADGSVTFTGLVENTEYVAYQGSPDRYVRLRVDAGQGTSADATYVRTNASEPLSVGSESSATATLANVASSVSVVTLQAANTARRGWTVYNDSTAVLYVKFGAGASATSYVVQLAAGGYYEMAAPIFTGIITGIWAAANGNARVTELVA